jgi:hypothetical protein
MVCRNDSPDTFFYGQKSQSSLAGVGYLLAAFRTFAGQVGLWDDLCPFRLLPLDFSSYCSYFPGMASGAVQTPAGHICILSLLSSDPEKDRGIFYLKYISKKLRRSQVTITFGKPFNRVCTRIGGGKSGGGDVV